MQISSDWSRSVAPDSIERIMSYWADDAVYMPPGQPALIGKEAIGKIVPRAGTWHTLSRKVKGTMNDSLGNPLTE